jgi:hypothetical protein
MQKKIGILLRIVLLNVLGLALSGLQLNLQVEDYACLKLWASIPGIVMTFLVRECYGSPKKQEFYRSTSVIW